jgi:CubicO group peptidase (beta-lactamase class C family)
VVRRLFILLALLASAAQAVVARAETAPATGTAPADLSADALRSFADEFVATTMAKYRVPGAACVVVKDGQVVYSRGYGFADVDRQRPVDPARTRFAVGSITKLVTATAVMQFVERGELSLDADVAPLLGPAVRIDNPYAPQRPVTLRQLLTHTAGFDQRYLGIGVRHPDLVPPLERVLRDYPPVCVMRPGDHIAYSDEGFMLAGYLIERRAGQRFEEYVEQRVLRPLGMNQSGFATGAGAADLTAGQSTGYEWRDGRRRVMRTLYVKTVPCGGLIATPDDLGAFMIAHLGGRPAGATGAVLRPESFRAMHQRQFGYDPAWDGMALGFYDRRLGGGGGAGARRVLAHGGIGPGMTSNLFLLPDEGVGCYFTFNVYDLRLLELPPEAFARHFFPDPAPGPRPPAAATDAGSAARFAGQYRHVSYPRRTIEKVQYLTDEISVRADEGGTLVVADLNPSEPGPQSFEPFGPAGRFRQTTGDARVEIGFREDADGNVTHLLVGAEAYELLPWAEHPTLHRRLFKACAALFLWAGLGWPLLRLALGWWVRHFRFRDLQARARRTARADRMLAAACLINVMFLIGFGFVLTNTTSDAFVCGPPPEMRLMLWLPPLAALLAVLGSARAVPLLVDAALSPVARLHRTLIAAVAIGFLPLLAYWNLLGFNY